MDVVRCNRCRFAIAFDNSNGSKSAVSVQYRKFKNIIAPRSESIYFSTFRRRRSSLRSNGHSRRRSGLSRLSSGKHSCWNPFRLTEFNAVPGENSVNRLCLEFYHFRPCPIWGWLYGVAIRPIELHSVLQSFTLIKIYIPGALKLGENTDQLFAIRRVVFWSRQFLFPIIHSKSHLSSLMRIVYLLLQRNGPVA